MRWTWGVVLSIALAALPLAAQEALPRRVEVRVDPHVELVSIIFRLAGNNEYNAAKASRYIEDVEKQFGLFRDHPAVLLATRLRESRSMGYNAPMSLAVFIKEVETLETTAPLDPWPETIDKRWTEDDVREFLAQARDFAKATEFGEFYARHQPLYDESVVRLEELIDREAYFEWFDSYFGEQPDTTFQIVISIINGPNNYAATWGSGDKTVYYCVLGVWSVDSEGIPEFAERVMPVVIHEFSHCYANPLVDAHLAELEASCKGLYWLRSAQMSQMAYGHWETMAYESLVRACVTRYTYDTQGEDAGDRQGQEEASEGFPWVPGLAQLLAEYNEQRDTYADLDAFFPRIVDYMNAYAERPEEKVNPFILDLLFVSALLTIVIALGAALGWKFGTGAAWRWLWIGASLWALGVALKAIVALLLNGPILGALKSLLPRAGYIAAGSMYVGLLTGVFEIGIVFAATHIWRQMARDRERAVAIGVGAGSFEALLIGIALLLSVLFAVTDIPGADSVRQQFVRNAGTTPFLWLIGPVERCLAICCHVGSRVLVLYAAARGRWVHFWCGFLLLSAVDTLVGVVALTDALGRISPWWVEAALVPFAIISVVAVIWCLRHWPVYVSLVEGVEAADMVVTEARP